MYHKIKDGEINLQYFKLKLPFLLKKELSLPIIILKITIDQFFEC